MTVVIQYNAIQCNAMQCNTIPYNSFINSPQGFFRVDLQLVKKKEKIVNSFKRTGVRRNRNCELRSGFARSSVGSQYSL